MFFSGITLSAQAQVWDSLKSIILTDTTVFETIQKTDSIATNFRTKADSLNSWLQSQGNEIESLRNKLQSKFDSLSKLSLSNFEITGKLDSLEGVWRGKVEQYNSKLSELKAQATNKLNEITLPSELQEPFKKLQSSISEYKLPGLDKSLSSSLGSFRMGEIPKLSLPTLNNQLDLNLDLEKYNGQLREVSQLGNKIGDYGKDVNSLVNGKLTEVKTLDKTLEGKVLGMQGMEQLTEGSEFISQAQVLKPDSAAIAGYGKKLLTEQVINQAQNHFEGKEVLLKEAMNKMSKLKGRYTEVKSMAELPKRLPNPLKGKPFIERLVPGVSFQIQASNYFLLDVNPMLMYKFSHRFSAGAGWNERLPFEELSVKQDQRVYGPRAAFEFKWTKGINFRLLPELMNTTIPPLIASSKGVDPAYREWVPSVFVGIKKDFTVYKTIKGNTEVLYNLYDKDGMSPYGDRLAVRFGFEFPMKKKAKTKAS